MAPNRQSLVFLLRDTQWKLVIFDIATKRQRDIGTGVTAAWSPDSQRLYVSTWGGSEKSARIINPATGKQLPLTGDLRAAAWVDENRVVAEKFVTGDSEHARLVIMRADGSIEREVVLPFAKNDDDA